MGIRRLPPDLPSALDLMERSELVRGVLGDEFLDHYLMAKRAHVDAYNRSLEMKMNDESMRLRISRFEIEHLLPIL
jgi:glutamine synthetase